MRAFCVFAGLAVVVVAGCNEPSTVVSGTVETRRVTLSAELGARVASVEVSDGDVVAAEQIVARLNCDVPDAQRAQAAAQLDAATAQVALVEAGARTQEVDAARADVAAVEQQLAMARRGARSEQIDQLEAGISGVDARIALAQTVLARAEQLVADGTTALAEADRARTELEVLQAERERLGAQLSEARRGARTEEIAVIEQRLSQARSRLSALEEGARTQEVDAARAQRAAATAQLALADAQVARCLVKSPVAGRVDVVAVDPGEVVTPGTPIAAVDPDGVLRVRTYASQQLIGARAVGDPVRVHVENAAATELDATVVRISEQAEFTAGNVQTPEDRMLLVFEVELELPSLEPGLVRPGMSVLVDFGAGAQ
jgi:HlyD family secretion protein